MRKSVGLAVVAGAASVFVSSAAQAAVIGTWGGGSGTTSGNWSSLGAPAWTNGTVPNAQGDTASYTVATGTAVSSTVNVDVVGGVTVGTIRVGGDANASWSFNVNNHIFLNEDGAGPLSATLLNEIQSTSTTGNPAILLNAGAGSLFLQDNLLISNTSNSTRSDGSFRIRAKIEGTGNITVENVNSTTNGAVSFQNQGAFSGNTTIAKGRAVFTRGDVFTPSPSTIVTIGAAGKGDASLLFNAASLGNIENKIVAAANSGGTLVFGATNTATGLVNIKSTNTDAGEIALDGDLTFTNVGVGTLSIGDRITGVGKLTKIGSGPMRVTNANTYAGGTVVDLGILAVSNDPDAPSQFGFHEARSGTLGSGDVTVNTAATRLEIEAGVAAINVISDIATVSLAGGGTVGTADFGYMLLGAGVNETVGMLLLGGIAQDIGTYGSTTSGATFQNDEFFSGPGVLNVTIVPEPASLSLLGFAAAGLLGRRRRA